MPSGVGAGGGGVAATRDRRGRARGARRPCGIPHRASDGETGGEKTCSSRTGFPSVLEHVLISGGAPSEKMRLKREPATADNFKAPYVWKFNSTPLNDR